MLDQFHDGEVPVQNAPLIQLKNGANFIPQHYLKYQHTLASVQRIVLGCHFDDRYPIFVSEDKQGIYIQVGIVGYDNYKSIDNQPNKKIVYGRRWRVEPELPTSEIIQTVFLALKKAREHEVREVFKLAVRNHKTTPFSCHQDLPLMANNAHLIKEVGDGELTFDTFIVRIGQLLSRIRYDHSVVEFLDIEERKNGNLLVDVRIAGTQRSQLEETHGTSLTLVLEHKCTNEFLYALMDKLIHLSDRYVEEHFTFNDFKRFSRQNSIQEIADLSLETRNKAHIQDDKFQTALEEINYETDKTRVPVVLDTQLAKKIAKNLSCFGALDGILPSL